MSAAARHTQLAVLGGGPGGYTAAFRAADLGLQATLIDRRPALGGVCLNVGCIPSKALLHAAKVRADAEHARAYGIEFAPPTIDLDKLRGWKQSTVDRLTGGLAGLARQRGVEVLHGYARLTDAHTLDLDGESLSFDALILATGSRNARLPGLPDGDPRVMDSTDALAIKQVPRRLLVVGGGIIGLEMASVYDALGSEVTVLELADQLLPECDPALLAPLQERLRARYAAIHLGTRLQALETGGDGLLAHYVKAGERQPHVETFDAVLIAVGRTPNTREIGLEQAGIALDAQGRAVVDSQRRTSLAHVHAIGDIAPGPMLAHKAIHEGRLAAEVISGEDVELDVRAMPAVVYTDPEVAWVGLTERQAEAMQIPFRMAAFPWAASGRALSSGSVDGLTRLLVDADSNRVLGAGIVGTNAGELIAEAGLAIELGADCEDLALTVHAHPTLSETIAGAAEVAQGTVTDLPRGARPE
jgi:dihydrolipoamide dehydrogenase